MVDQRPDKDAREKAKQTIRAAFATGRIVEADHDQRLQAVDNAQSGTELAMITQGLDPDVPDSWRSYQPVGTASGAGGSVVESPTSPTPADSMEPPPEPGEPVSTWVPEPAAPREPDVPYGGPAASSSGDTTIVYAAGAAAAVGRGVSRLVGTVVAIAVALVVGGIGIGISGGIGELFEGVENIAPGSGAEVQTQDGFAEMLEDLEGRVGHTEVFEATLYPDYAIVDVPVSKGSPRADSLIYRGSWEDWTKGTSTYQPFDLSQVDASVLEGLCDRAKDAGLVEEPKADCYVIIRRPTGEEKTWMWAYVSNEYSESGYLGTDLDGKETNRWPEQ